MFRISSDLHVTRKENPPRAEVRSTAVSDRWVLDEPSPCIFLPVAERGCAAARVNAVKSEARGKETPLQSSMSLLQFASWLTLATRIGKVKEDEREPQRPYSASTWCSSVKTINIWCSLRREGSATKVGGVTPKFSQVHKITGWFLSQTSPMLEVPSSLRCVCISATSSFIFIYT